MARFDTEVDRIETRRSIVSAFLIGGMLTLVWAIFLARLTLSLFRWLLR